jgi:predicted RNase H-like HicB family nuclease
VSSITIHNLDPAVKERLRIRAAQHGHSEAGVTTYTFRIVVEPDEERWRAYAPALEAQGASTWGYTREEALANIREVLEMIVGELAEEGSSVPADVAVSEEPLVAVTV